MTDLIVRLAAATVLAVALFSAPPAQAAPFTPELEADYSAALAWWGVSSPPLCTSVALELLPTDPSGEGAAARATQRPPEGPPGECAIEAFEDRLPVLPCAQEVVLRHEVGHLLGYGHSPDPTSIMASQLDYDLWCPLPPSSDQWPVWRMVRRECHQMLPGRGRSGCYRRLRRMGYYLRGQEVREEAAT